MVLDENIELLAAEVIELFGDLSRPFANEKIAGICTILGVDRPPLEEDNAFLVLVAVTLSPIQAIHYSLSDPRPRWIYIRNYLEQFANMSSGDLEVLARHIAKILDDQSNQRARTPSGYDYLISNQSSSCAICRLPFFRTPQSILTRDLFRPLWKAPKELVRPEIDHINPINWTGDNSLDNLQILCRACNAAKSDGLRLALHKETSLAQIPLEDVPRIHFFRLLIWLVNDRGKQCDINGCKDGELTMRLVRPEASLVRANLRLVCYPCTSAQA